MYITQRNLVTRLFCDHIPSRQLCYSELLAHHGENLHVVQKLVWYVLAYLAWQFLAGLYEIDLSFLLVDHTKS